MKRILLAKQVSNLFLFRSIPIGLVNILCIFLNCFSNFYQHEIDQDRVELRRDMCIKLCYSQFNKGWPPEVKEGWISNALKF